MGNIARISSFLIAFCFALAFASNTLALKDLPAEGEKMIQVELKGALLPSLARLCAVALFFSPASKLVFSDGEIVPRQHLAAMKRVFILCLGSFWAG